MALGKQKGIDIPFHWLVVVASVTRAVTPTPPESLRWQSRLVNPCVRVSCDKQEARS